MIILDFKLAAERENLYIAFSYGIISFEKLVIELKRLIEIENEISNS